MGSAHGRCLVIVTGFRGGLSVDICVHCINFLRLIYTSHFIKVQSHMLGEVCKENRRERIMYKIIVRHCIYPSTKPRIYPTPQV